MQLCNNIVLKMQSMKVEFSWLYMIFCSGFVSSQDLFQSSLSLDHGSHVGSSLDYNPDLSYQLSFPSQGHDDPSPTRHEATGQMLEVPVFVLMPDKTNGDAASQSSSTGRNMEANRPGYSLVQLGVESGQENTRPRPEEFPKPEPISAGYKGADDSDAYDPFGMLLDQRPQARIGPYFSMGHTPQHFQPVSHDSNYPTYESYDHPTLPPAHGQIHPTEVHPHNTHHIYRPETPTYGFAPPTQTQNSGGFYQAPQQPNQIQIYPQNSNNHQMASSPVSSSATSYVSYQSPQTDPTIQQYGSIANPSQRHISASNTLPYPNSVLSYPQPNPPSPFTQALRLPVTPTHVQKPKQRNVQNFLGAILTMLKRHMPQPPPLVHPMHFALGHYPPMAFHSRQRRPIAQDYYRKKSPKKPRYRRRKRYRGRTSRQRLPRHYARKSRDRHDEEVDDEEDVSVLGEDVYDGNEDVFDLDVTENDEDYSVVGDADVYTSDYEEDYT